MNSRTLSVPLVLELDPLLWIDAFLALALAFAFGPPECPLPGTLGLAFASVAALLLLPPHARAIS